MRIPKFSTTAGTQDEGLSPAIIIQAAANKMLPNLVLKNITSDELALLLRFNREGIQVLKDAVTWLREKDLNQ